MNAYTPHYSAQLDAHNEAEVRKMLVDYYTPSYQERVEGFVDTSLAIDPFADRFLYLRSVIGEGCFTDRAVTLVSGFGMGSEMIMGRDFGLGKIYGVEVEQGLVDIIKKRLVNFADMYPDFYEGENLPYGNGMFSLVTSGHVIEHTSRPDFYLQEIMRVVSPGGFLFLEFPNRYYWKEPHTHQLSFEWLPKVPRDHVLNLISSKYFPLSGKAKQRYHSIVSTHLQPVSLGSIKQMLSKSGYSTTIIDYKRAAPGIYRCVIRRD